MKHPPTTPTPLTPLALTLVVGLAGCDSPESFLGGSILTVGIAGLLALALIIYAIVDLVRGPMDTGAKIFWGVVIWVVPFLGAIAYLLIGKR